MYSFSRVNVTEVFGVHCEVSVRSYKGGWMTSQLYDLVDGCDLRDVEQAKGLLADIARLQPRLVLIQFPSTWYALLRHSS